MACEQMPGAGVGVVIGKYCPGRGEFSKACCVVRIGRLACATFRLTENEV